MSVHLGQVGTGRLRPEQLALLSGPLGDLHGDGASDVRVVSASFLREGVYRLQLEGATCNSVVVKRQRARHAQLEECVSERWLAAVGLRDVGPPRRAAIGEADGRHVWQVYDDLGPFGLDRPDVDATCVEAAMDGLAQLHAAFSGHPLLAEPRFAAGDLGTYFYVNSIHDAARCVAQLVPPVVRLSVAEQRVKDEVQHLLLHLMKDEPRRVRLLRDQAGPQTLVHGDLTRANVFVLPGDVHRLRLIDWDHVGVGPAGFDISTHVSYYPAHQRHIVLERYRQAMADRGFPFDDGLDWALLVETFEAGRLANQIIWIALSILEGGAWGFRRLAAWRDALAEVLPGSGIGAGEST